MAQHRYLNAEGTQVPSVTTILKIIDKPALVGWAAKTMTEKTRAAIKAELRRLYEGRGNAEDLDTVMQSMLRAADTAYVPPLYDDKSAADAGTFAHLMIENKVRGKALLDGVDFGDVDDSVVTAAHQAVASFAEWADMTRLELVATEVSLVDDELDFGGTVDAVGIVNGNLAIVDWKTSKSIYEEYLGQVAAYAELWHSGRLNYGDQAKPKYLGEEINSVHVLRLGKESTTFQHTAFFGGDLDVGWSLFEAARVLYRAKALAAKRVGRGR